MKGDENHAWPRLQCIDELVLLDFGVETPFDDDYACELREEMVREHCRRMSCDSPGILVIETLALSRHAVKLIQIQTCD